MNIINYIHYYFGQKAIYDGKEWQIIDIGIRYVKLRSYTEKDDLGLLVRVEVRHEDLKLVLRRIESLTTDEKLRIADLSKQFRPENHVLPATAISKRWAAEQTHYLLSLGIDLFGLIDAGLAIDAATIKTHQP